MTRCNPQVSLEATVASYRCHLAEQLEPEVPERTHHFINHRSVEIEAAFRSGRNHRDLAEDLRPDYEWTRAHSGACPSSVLSQIGQNTPMDHFDLRLSTGDQMLDNDWGLAYIDVRLEPKNPSAPHGPACLGNAARERIGKELVEFFCAWYVSMDKRTFSAVVVISADAWQEFIAPIPEFFRDFGWKVWASGAFFEDEQ